MLKTMVKFNGTEEPFTAKKVARWAEWAAKKLGHKVDWPSIVITAVNECPEKMSTQDFQKKLIDVVLRGEDWPHYQMAGRLYAPMISKATYGHDVPTVQQLHQKLVGLGLMDHLSYTDAEYAAVEKVIDHELDKDYIHSRIEYIYKKYAVQNRVTGKSYETPQFVYMRMAMALSESFPTEQRMKHIRKWYHYLSSGKLNAPTPNYVNLGTPLKGFTSCCIYTNHDSARSIGVGLHIAYTMTYMSAGTGTYFNSRSIGDEVRGGAIEHQGKLPYLRAEKAMVKCNLQNGRGGALNVSWSAFDPEAETLVALQNPMSVEDKKIRGIDYTMTISKFMVRFAARKQKLFYFNSHTAPDLHAALFSGDVEHFENLYNKYEADPLFVKTYFNARELILNAMNEAYETGRYYLAWADTINMQTPFYDTIWATNLCVEIMLPTSGYADMQDLYKTEDVGYIRFQTTDGNRHELAASQPVYVERAPVNALRAARRVIPAIELEQGEQFQFVKDGLHFDVMQVDERKAEPEVAMCNIAGICPGLIESDEEYADVMYYALLMIDRCIHMTHYELPHIGFTSKNRMNAGVGIIGDAYWMAKNGYSYTTREGKGKLFELNETHYYHAITQSIRLGREFGNAPWIHRTKYPEGYLIFDDGAKAVMEIHDQPFMRDWDQVRKDLVTYGGGRFSCLVAHMPGESSSKGAGQPNGRYPVRKAVMTKTDNGIVTRFAAPESDVLHYESCWDLSSIDQIDIYGLAQYWTDQGISADTWKRLPPGETVKTSEMMNDVIYMTKMGMKSRYYTNSLTSSLKELEDGTTVMVEHLNTDNGKEEAADCVGGCKM